MDCNPDTFNTNALDNFPQATWANDEVMSYFRERFGFNVREATALIGE